MRVTVKHAGSGTFSEDARREAAGHLAANNLDRGWGAACVSGDHSGSERCVDTINRLAQNFTKAQFDPTKRNTALLAAKKLRSGVGVNTASADHSSNTCADVIAAVDDTY